MLQSLVQQLQEAAQQARQQAGTLQEASAHTTLPGLDGPFEGGPGKGSRGSVPGLQDLKGSWSGAFQAYGGGGGAANTDFDVKGADWQWGNYRMDQASAALHALQLKRLHEGTAWRLTKHARALHTAIAILSGLLTKCSQGSSIHYNLMLHLPHAATVLSKLQGALRGAVGHCDEGGCVKFLPLAQRRGKSEDSRIPLQVAALGSCHSAEGLKAAAVVQVTCRGQGGRLLLRSNLLSCHLCDLSLTQGML